MLWLPAKVRNFLLSLTSVKSVEYLIFKALLFPIKHAAIFTDILKMHTSRLDNLCDISGPTLLRSENMYFRYIWFQWAQKLHIYSQCPRRWCNSNARKARLLPVHPLMSVILLQLPDEMMMRWDEMMMRWSDDLQMMRSVDSDSYRWLVSLHPYYEGFPCQAGKLDTFRKETTSKNEKWRSYKEAEKVPNRWSHIKILAGKTCSNTGITCKGEHISNLNQT